MLNGLDLFSGIGGLTLALAEWVRPVAYCENDRHAAGVLLSRMSDGQLPTAPIWDDIKTLRGTMLPEIDVLYGGFPCQDVSCAGARAGLDGIRTGLFHEAIRLVRECRPIFVFLENVPGIRKYVPIVRGELEALGYDCRDGFLSAAEVGANHIRNRWWLLVYTNDSRRRQLFQQEQESGRSKSANTRSDGKVQSLEIAGSNRWQESRDSSISNAVNKHGRDLQRAEHKESANHATDASWWSIEPDVGRVANGVPARMDRIRGLGNAVVPLQAREAFKRLMGLC